MVNHDRQLPENSMNPSQNATTDTIKLFPLRAMIGAVLALIGVIIFAESIPNETLAGMNLTDSMHTIVFFVGTYLLFGLIQHIRHPKPISLGITSGLVFLCCFVLGIGIELVQPAFGRNASFLDVWYDILGTSSAIILIVVTQSGKLRWLGYPAAILLLSLASVRPLYYHWVDSEANALFPGLLDFEANWQKEFFRPSAGAFLSDSLAPKAWPGNTSNTLKWNFEPAVYPGVHIKHFPRDWRSQSTLLIDIYSKNPRPFTLSLRIHDTQHDQTFEDRFNQKSVIGPGLTTLEISLEAVKDAPAKRQMDMSSIDEIILFVHQPDETGAFYIDNIRLSD